MSLTATLLTFKGDRDGLRFGRVRWSDGLRLGWFYDKLSGVVRIIAVREGDRSLDVTASEAKRVPSLRKAIVERLGEQP